MKTGSARQGVVSVKFSKFVGLVFLELFNCSYCSLSRILPGEGGYAA